MISRRFFLRGALATTAMTAIAPVLPKLEAFSGVDLASGADMTAVTLYRDSCSPAASDFIGIQRFVVYGADAAGARMVEVIDALIEEPVVQGDKAWRTIDRIEWRPWKEEAIDVIEDDVDV